MYGYSRESSHIALLAVINRITDNEFNVTEEMADLHIINLVTTGTNLMEELDNVVVKPSLRYLNFVRIENKDASSVSSIRNGLVTIIKEQK